MARSRSRSSKHRRLRGSKHRGLIEVGLKHPSTYKDIYTYMYMQRIQCVCIYVCVNVCVYVCMYGWMDTCMYEHGWTKWNVPELGLSLDSDAGVFSRNPTTDFQLHT